ncbi:hypothetical protein [Serratia quinivorans]|uniref:hypothetical protein n=1 Tax=Serratia quinivorans TaxID=137545 RepID=UPI0034C5D4C1
MDKLRADFEKWLEETHGLYGEDVEWQEERNCYAKFGIHLAYQAWKQSRASIVVELPERMTEVVADTLIHGRVMANDMRTACAKALRSIGLSIKGE